VSSQILDVTGYRTGRRWRRVGRILGDGRGVRTCRRRSDGRGGLGHVAGVDCGGLPQTFHTDLP
jgi:hypothetical protein